MQCVRVPLGPLSEDDLWLWGREYLPPYLEVSGRTTKLFELDADGGMTPVELPPRPNDTSFLSGGTGELRWLNCDRLLAHLEDGRYLCTDSNDGPFLCRDSSGKVIFQLPICCAYDNNVVVDPQFLFILDFQHKLIHVYDHSGVQQLPPFPMPAYLRWAESGYCPHIQLRDGVLIVRGIDEPNICVNEKNRYVKYICGQNGVLSMETIWEPPESGVYFWRFEERGDRALLMGMGSAEYGGRQRCGMVCYLINVEEPCGSGEVVAVRSISGMGGPNVGELGWIDDKHFYCTYDGSYRGNSKIVVYSLKAGRLFTLTANGHIWDVAAHGYDLYIVEGYALKKPAERSLLILRDVLSKPFRPEVRELEAYSE